MFLEQHSVRSELIAALKSLPSNWLLVPVSGKRPLGGKGWNKHPYTPQQLIQLLCKHQYCTGFGLLTGTAIGKDSYLLAVDQDGDAAAATLAKLTQGKQLPPTIAFTSGRSGRCQYLFRIPDRIAPSIVSRKLEGKLELRWTGMISILPPSIHPLTYKPYQWLAGCKPTEVAIAPAPKELIQQMVKQQPPRPQTKYRNPNKSHRPLNCFIPAQEINQIASLLSRLHPCRVDDYHEWIRVGMALYSYSPALLPLWDNWSRQSTKYKPGECASKWSTFNPTRISINTLYYLASIDSSEKLVV